MKGAFHFSTSRLSVQKRAVIAAPTSTFPKCVPDSSTPWNRASSDERAGADDEQAIASSLAAVAQAALVGALHRAGVVRAVLVHRDLDSASTGSHPAHAVQFVFRETGRK